MANANVFEANIAVVDKACGAIAAVLGHFKGLDSFVEKMSEHGEGLRRVFSAAFGEAEREAEHAGRAVKSAGEAAASAEKEVGKVSAHARSYVALVSHVRLLKNNFIDLHGAVGEVGSSITEFLPMLAGLGAAGGLVGAFEVVEKAADHASELNKFAKTAGVTAQQFAELAHAAKMTDVPIETMQTGLERLNRNIQLTVSGKSKDLAGLFKQAGIELHDAAGHTRSAADLLPELAEKFEHTQNPALRTAAAMALFGKSGADLLPLLMEGREVLQKFADQADRVSFVPKGEQAEQLEKYHRSILTLGEAAGGFADKLGARLAPVLAPIIDKMTEWITANREWITTAIAGKVEELARWLEHVDLGQVITQTLGWAKWLVQLGGHLGGVSTAIGAVALVLGSPLLGAITKAAEAIKLFSGILRGLAVLAWANPIIAAIGLVTIAALIMWEHWDWIRDHFIILWDAVSAAFSEAWRGTLDWVSRRIASAAAWISDAWRGVKAFFSDLWSGVKQAFADAWNYIEPLVQKLRDAAGWLQNSWVGRELGIADPHAAAGGASAAPSGAPGGGSGSSSAAPGGLLGSPWGAPLILQGGPGGAPAPAQQGRVGVHVEFANTPPGTRVRVDTVGGLDYPHVDVGYAMPLSFSP